MDKSSDSGCYGFTFTKCLSKSDSRLKLTPRFFICLIIFCSLIYGVVYISPVLHRNYARSRRFLHQFMYTTVIPNRTSHVVNYSQSKPVTPRYNITHHVYRQKGNKTQTQNSRILFNGPIPQGLPPISTLDPSDIADNPVMIIIVGYMHTGSTYLGYTFQQHPDTFYWYEALRPLTKQTRERDTATYLNGKTRKLSGVFVDTQLAATSVKNMLECNHKELDLITLIYHFNNVNTEQMRDTGLYFKCQNRPLWHEHPHGPTLVKRQKQMKELFYTEESQQRVVDCLPYLTNKCLKTKIRVLKFIRMELDSAVRLLEELPRVKVIHLFRDPRSMMDSQVRKGDRGTRLIPAFKRETQWMCGHMRRDIKHRAILKENYPDNIMGIRYEDMARDPMGATKALFQFTGVPFTQKVEEHVRKASINSSRNSTVREAVWRSHLDQLRLDIINEHCSDVLFALGYIKYNDINKIRKRSNPTNTLTNYTDFASP